MSRDLASGFPAPPYARPAAVLRAPGEPLSLEAVNIGPLRPDEVLVRLVGSGICHTDLGVIAAPGKVQTPIVLGHEGAGIIEWVGSAVGTLVPGDHVVMSYDACWRCDNCSRGLPMCCRDFVSLNLIGGRADGTSALSAQNAPVYAHFFGQSAWATHAVASSRNCVRVDVDLPLEMLAPLGCGFQTGAGAVLKSLRPAPGSSIAIFGVGSVGLTALLAAVASDCSEIVAVDIADSHLAIAAELGATYTLNASDANVVQEIRDLTDGLGVQYSVDCIGVGTAVRGALECLRSPGVCATVGFQGAHNEITIDHGHLLFGRSLVGVIEGDAIPASFVPEMIELYRSGAFPFDQLIATYPFEQINDAIDAVGGGKVIKAVLTFGAHDSL